MRQLIYLKVRCPMCRIEYSIVFYGTKNQKYFKRYLQCGCGSLYPMQIMEEERKEALNEIKKTAGIRTPEGWAKDETSQ